MLSKAKYAEVINKLWPYIYVRGCTRGSFVEIKLFMYIILITQTTIFLHCIFILINRKVKLEQPVNMIDMLIPTLSVCSME